MKYRAFISYSHADEGWGRWLHKALETYRVPGRLAGVTTANGPVPRRLVPIFRDREELASATDLGEVITEALRQSAAMIVICSPAAASSRWVNEEILTFKRLGREHRIFCLIVDGEPNASERAETRGEECFPPALRYRLGADGELTGEPTEPIAADAREGKDGKPGARLKLLAGLLGVGLDELRQRDQQRRHRRLVAIAASALFGMAVTTILATAAIFARTDALRQRARAEVEAATARQTTEFLVSLFEVSDPGEARGNTITAREILDRGAGHIERDLEQQPEVRANLMHTMGKVYTGLGLYEPATDFLRRSLELRRELLENPHAVVIANANSLGAALYLKGDYQAAEAIYRDALSAARRLYSGPSPETTTAMNGLADVLTQFERDTEAEALYREALAMDVSLQGNRHPDAARSMAGLARSLLYQQRLAEAGPFFRDALEIRIETLGDDHPLVAETGNNLASMYYFRGNTEAAEPLFRDALRRYRHIYGSEHPEVSSIINNLGRVVLEQGRLREAEVLLSEALAIDRQLKDPQHDDLAFTLNNLGLALTGLGEYGGAEPLLVEALEITRVHEHRLQGPVLSNLADLYCRMGRYEEAGETLVLARPLILEDYPGEAWRAANLDSIEGARLAGGREFDRAEKLLVGSLAPIERRWSRGGLFTRNAVQRVIGLYDAWDRPGEAEKYRGSYAVPGR